MPTLSPLRRPLAVAAIILLGICTADPTPASPAEEVSLPELRALVEQGQYDEAIELASSMVDQIRVTGDDAHPDEAAILDSWVEALYRSGSAMEAETLELAERALSLRRQAAAGDPAGLVSTLLQLGNLYIYRSQPDSARSEYERALVLLERDPAPDGTQLGLVLNNLGVSWKQSGDYSQASKYYERALELREQLLGPDHPDVASSLNNLANILVVMGDYRGARQAHERALAIREAHYGPDHEWVAESLNNLATVLGYEGNYDAALAAQERAVAVLATALGEDHDRYWTARLNLAVLYADMGDHRGAKRIYEAVLERQRSRFGDDHVETLETVDALATTLVALGDLERAEELYELSLRISAEAYGEGSVTSAYTLQGLGECLAKARRYDEAADRFDEALRIWEAELEPESPELSELMHRIAEVKLAQGEFDVAAELAQRSATYIERDLGPDHPLFARALRIDALTARQSGDSVRALRSALQAEDVSRRHTSATIRILPDSRALDMAMTRTLGLDLAVGLLHDQERSERTARVYDALIRSRALVLDELASRQQTYDRAGDGSLEPLVAEVRAARMRLANLTLRGPGWEEVSVYRQMLEEVRSEKDLAERKLATASRRYRDEQAERAVGLEELRAALPDDCAIVSYVRFDPCGDDASEEDTDVRYGAFVLAPADPDPRFVDLGEAHALDDLIAQWREQAASGAAPQTEEGKSEGGPDPAAARGLVRRSRDPRAQEAAYEEVAKDLRRHVWDPVVSRTRAAARVFVVPDGNLHLVSLYALETDDGAFLVEDGPAIVRLPTERFLGAIGIDRTSRSEDPRLLVLGDPDFGPAVNPTLTTPVAAASTSVSRPDCPSLHDLVFEPLPGTSREAARVSESWQECHQPEAAPLVLRGAGASEAAFKRNVHGQSVLHLATHGFLLPADCHLGGREADAGPRRNPLLWSGLALAGANARMTERDSGDDGILTAEELAALDLTHAEWAVLSACDTGLGELRGRGEGVFGLARAFQIAGARTVIMSLWAVDDQATLDWMLALYEGRLRGGLSTFEAVRQASVQTLATRRASGQSDHPFYWAAFVSSGEWN